MRCEEGRQTPDRDGKPEQWIARRQRDFAASPNEQLAGSRSPKRRSAVENRRGELICHAGNQGEGKSQQKKSGSCEAPRSKKSARKKAHVWCIRRRHSSFRTSDNTLTDYGRDQSSKSGVEALTEQEVASGTNQSCRANTDSSHFVGSNVVFVVLGSIVPITIFSICAVWR